MTRASVHHGIFPRHHGTGGPAMHHRISNTLHALRQDLAARLGDDVIRAACRTPDTPGATPFLLTPAAIIHWFLIQVFHGNTALTHVSLLAGRAFFRLRLSARPVPGFPWPSSGSCSADHRAFDPRHRGHRPLARPSHLPGQRLVVLHARHPGMQAHFGQPGNQAKGCGFPVAHLLALFHAGTGLLLEVNAAPGRRRTSQAWRVCSAGSPPVMCWSRPTAASARSPAWRW